jgi:hypothetical protein
MKYLQKYKKYIPLVAFAFILFINVSFASSGNDIAFDHTELTKALVNIGKQLAQVLASIAPVAIGVTGVFLGWKYGVGFFKKLLG